VSRRFLSPVCYLTINEETGAPEGLHYLAYFDYDVKKARAFPAEFAEQVKRKRYKLTDFVPALEFATTPVEREDALLAIILADESRLLPVLATFLASPESNGRRRMQGRF
jgi:hypothetical protein